MLTPAATVLTEPVARQLLNMPNSARVRVHFLRSENHTWRLTVDGSAYYVKAHTKAWYTDLDSVTGAVRHEQIAHQLLAEAGLPAPDLVATHLTTSNAIGWPHLITRALPGRSLPEVLTASASIDERDAALRATGRHLRRMHDIVFDHPGYLAESASPTLTDPRGWQHPIWRFERFLQSSIRIWADGASTVSPNTLDVVMTLLADTMATLRASFDPPRFTHGDCHANGIFLDGAGRDWEVTGVLDMEVASAANPAFDFNKLIIELVGLQRLDTYDWWTPLFDGYGDEPHFDLTRLLLISAGHPNYTCLDQTWGLDRIQIIEHVLRSRTWRELFRPA